MAMTARLVFEATLIELSKTKTPPLKLYEFNYLFNKAINQYINKVYNTYDLNQQTTDDLRVLKATAYLRPHKWNEKNQALMTDNTANAGSYLSSSHRAILSLHGATYEVAMPIDYLHLLNCVCIYYVAKLKDCWDAGSYIEIPAIRLTADSWSQIVTDIYNRPSPMRPYYYIHNQNSAYAKKDDSNELQLLFLDSYNLPTNPLVPINSDGTEKNASGVMTGTDMTGVYKVTSNTVAVYEKNSRYYYEDPENENSWKEITKSGNETKIKIFGNLIQITGVEGSPVDATSDPIKNIKEGKAEKVYIWVLNPESTLPQNDATTGTKSGSNFPRTFRIDANHDGKADFNVSLVEKPAAIRTGNVSNVRMEIRYGKDDTLFQLKEVQVDYVKSPQFIRLTQEQIDLTEDTSQIMEFPDYVNQEIVNELVHLVMERVADPRIQSNILITNTIARPTGQLQQPQAQQA